jgi:hypothetical protein
MARGDEHGAALARPGQAGGVRHRAYYFFSPSVIFASQEISMV